MSDISKRLIKASALNEASTLKKAAEAKKEVPVLNTEGSKIRTQRLDKIDRLNAQTLVSIREELSRTKTLLSEREAQAKAYESEISALKTQLAQLKNSSTASNNEVKELLLQVQDENLALKKKYALLSSKMDASYTAKDLAEYFNDTIDSFNEKMNDTQGSVNYVINTMDVDLKAQIVKSKNELRFLTDPESTSDSSISSVKITINAIPK